MRFRVWYTFHDNCGKSRVMKALAGHKPMEAVALRGEWLAKGAACGTGSEHVALVPTAAEVASYLSRAPWSAP